MDLPRSTYYDVPVAASDDLVTAEIQAICGSCRNYGYRRVTAELRNRDFLVNSKKVRRIMRAHALSPKKKRRYIATTDSDHDSPIYPNIAKGLKIDAPISFGSETSRLSPSPRASSIWRSFSTPGRARLSAMLLAEISIPG